MTTTITSRIIAGAKATNGIETGITAGVIAGVKAGDITGVTTGVIAGITIRETCRHIRMAMYRRQLFRKIRHNPQRPLTSLHRIIIIIRDMPQATIRLPMVIHQDG